MVEQFDGWLVEPVARGVGRRPDFPDLWGGEQQAGFLDRERGLHRPYVFFKQVTGRARQVLDHRRRYHACAGCQLALQTDELLFEQRQCLGYPDQYPVEKAGQRLAGRNQRHAVVGHTVTGQVLLKALGGEKGVGAADHSRVSGKAGRQSAKAVIKDQDPALQGQPDFRHVVEQVLVSGIECLKRLILLFGLANKIKLSERADEQGHWQENSVQACVCHVSPSTDGLAEIGDFTYFLRFDTCPFGAARLLFQNMPLKAA